MMVKTGNTGAGPDHFRPHPLAFVGRSSTHVSVGYIHSMYVYFTYYLILVDIYIMLYNIVFYYTIVCYIILYYMTLYYIILHVDRRIAGWTEDR